MSARRQELSDAAHELHLGSGGRRCRRHALLDQAQKIHAPRDDGFVRRHRFAAADEIVDECAKLRDDPELDAIYQRNIRAISAINRQRGVGTIWVGQLLNRERLGGEGRYGWLPLVRDRDLWPMQQDFNALLERTARELGDVYVGVPAQSFTGADFVDQGHFSKQGAQRFADALAPVVRETCR